VAEKTDVILAEKRPDLLDESPQTRAARMSRAEAIDMQNRRKRIEQDVYGSFTFSPTIDPVSKEIGNLI